MSDEKNNLSEQDLQSVQLRELMLHSVASEFARPLSLIALNREYLQTHLEHSGPDYSREKVAQALTDIEDATVCLNRLADNFVDVCACLCSAVTPHSELLDLRSLLESVCADSAEIYRAIGVRLQLVCSDEEHYLIYADSILTERVLLNLLSNGLRACAPGGCVVFALNRRADVLELTVSDDGCGISPAAAAAAFEPFKQPEHSGEQFQGGAGIGLYLCGEYSRLMGWKIDIRPAQPGTCVTLEIPAQQNAAGQLCFHSPLEQLTAWQATRAAVLRELHCVPGLERLRGVQEDETE